MKSTLKLATKFNKVSAIPKAAQFKAPSTRMAVPSFAKMNQQISSKSTFSSASRSLALLSRKQQPQAALLLAANARIFQQTQKRYGFFGNLFKGSGSKTTETAAPKPAAAAAPSAKPKTSIEKFANQDLAMACFQCEQTMDGTGCTTVGVCGKTPVVAAEQDYLVFQLKVLSYFMTKARLLGAPENFEMNQFVLRGMFSTLTNVNFDENRFFNEFCTKAAKYIQEAKANYEALCQQKGIKPDLGNITNKPWSQAVLQAAKFDSVQDLANRGKAIGLVKRMESFGPNKDAFGMQELITYGLKGLCAYAEHAEVLGKYETEVFAFAQETLAFLTTEQAMTDIGKLLEYALRVGEVNLKVMSLLEAGGISNYGVPVPTKVRTTALKGKCILVSGHDLKDLEMILKASQGKGINVYTHGELLPAHGYPGLKEKYPHLAGNWGSAWQNQKTEFAAFPGAIVMTTNCLIEPRKSYADRLFTTNVTGWSGVKHIGDEKNYAQVVEKALACEGFKEDDADPKYITTGFGKDTILSNAPAVIDAIKAGAIKRFFVIGGCDGAEAERSYFGDLARSTPKDTMILTLGCGKYRFIKDDLGSIGPFPRVLDLGQCNDSYGAIQVAVALAQAFKTDVNSLPLSFAVSWFEQKAAAVLLTLLHLGVKNIRLGPALPAFITPNVLNILVEKFNIAPIGDVQKDLTNMMAGK